MIFINYAQSHFNDCMDLFDQNCPMYFASNERTDYQEYLKTTNDLYKVAYDEEKLVAVFGMGINEENDHAYITWIMVSPDYKGKGTGTQMMKQTIDFAHLQSAQIIDIAASHLSAPFFAKFGAITVKTIKHGWGPEMHRVDMQLHL